MIGLLFLATVAVWLWVCIWLSRKLASLVPAPAWRSPVMWGVLILLLASPFVDEVIGKYQFEALCRANGIESADVSRARGKRVKLDIGTQSPLVGTIMPGTVENKVYRAANSEEIVIQHKDYFAFGGWLMRYTPLSMGSNHPMLFSGGCIVNYVERDAIFSKNNISLVN